MDSFIDGQGQPPTGATLVGNCIVGAFGVALSAFLTYAGLEWAGPCDKPLATFILVLGIVGLATFVVRLFAIALLIFAGDCGKVVGAALAMLVACASLFAFIWFIIGNVWTFSTSAQHCPAHDGQLFNLSFWYIIVTYIIAGSAIFIALCVLCIACLCSSRS